ncbi:MAG TPA: polysaccharide deacetylase family protein [Gammaproteobacteria bacterium]|nr:polysaccharide deacetylase family protein [Gammaproteobacteria bacterium]
MNRLLSLLYHDLYRTSPVESGFLGAAADRYKLPLPEFDLQLERVAAVLDEAPVLVTEHQLNAARPRVTITVDDGGISYYTDMADRLEERGWRGHCFVATGWIGRGGFLHTRHLRELHRRGHLIGTHSVTHPGRFAACTPVQMLNEWRESRATLEEILGTAVTVASVPGGYFSQQVAEAADEAGIKHLFTSEPESLVRKVGSCHVYGRYTVRRGDGPDYAARLVTGVPTAVCGAWLKWNAKKLPKAILGAEYAGLAALAARFERNVRP